MQQIPDPAEFSCPEWVNWLAQDADGSWWGYEAEPHPAHLGWYENEVGRSIKLVPLAANPDWAASLIRRNTSR